MLFHRNYCVCSERFDFPKGIIQHQSKEGRKEALGRKKKLQDCHLPIQISCTHGWKIIPQKWSFQKKKVFTWQKAQGSAAVTAHSWAAAGAFRSTATTGPPSSSGRQVCLHKWPLVGEENLMACETACGSVFILWLGKGAGVCFFTKKGKTAERNREGKEKSKQMWFYRNRGTIYPQHSKQKLEKHLEKSENKLKLVGRLWQSWQLKLPLARWQQCGINLCVRTYPWKTPSWIWASTS